MSSFADRYSKKKDSDRPFKTLVERSSSELVYLVRGKDNGIDAWHYVFVAKNKLPLFLKKVDSGSIDVAEYGNVLYSGWGQDPSQDIIDKVKEQYD